jgi:carbamoyl-phosphate synthase large subunit
MLARSLMLSVADHDKADAAALGEAAVAAGFAVIATPGTGAALAARGLPVQVVDPDAALNLVRAGGVGVVVNTPTRGYTTDRSGFALRRAAFELNVPTLTSLDSARALIEAFAT